MMDVNLQAVEKLVQDAKLDLRLDCDIEIIEELDGKPRVVFKNADKYPPETFDKILYALGGSTPVNFLKSMGVECDDKSWPIINELGETNISDLFLIGDLDVGKKGGSIITAYNSAYRAAQQIMTRIKDRNG